MKLTKVEEEGLRLAVTLAQSGTQMTLPELSEKEDLSEALVAKVLSKLRQGGVVSAARGRNGGYELACPPESLTVADILRALDQPLLQGCFNKDLAATSSGTCCPHGKDCGLRPVWRRIETQIAEVMERITLSDLARSERHVERRIGAVLP
ncbi:MAG: Rrf2 family transcriptional regulator [Myxococcota bacterium]|jgi:Rrf2 family protein|nr:Rrf2 family transcriptional regulator [Myxococcota bacterium]